MQRIAPLDPESAAVQRALLRRKIAAGAGASARDDGFDRRALEKSTLNAAAGFIGALDGEATYSRRSGTTQDLARLEGFVCWCVFASQAGPLLVALDEATTLAAALSGLGKPIEIIEGAAVGGVDRFLASVFAKRIAGALASTVCDGEGEGVVDRLALGASLSDLRMDEFDGGVDIFEFSQFKVGDAISLRFLIVRPQSAVSSAATSVDPRQTKEPSGFSNSMSRHVLAAPVRIIAKKRFTQMSFSAAAALGPGDILRCENDDDDVEIIAMPNRSGKKVGDATIGKVDNMRALQFRQSASSPGGLLHKPPAKMRANTS